MGVLRFFLALVVVFGHTSPDLSKTALNLMNGDGGIAIQSFYIISGFYMALIARKYHLHELKFNHIKNFYFSRFFRIYPLYYMVLIVSLTFNMPNFPHPPLQAITELASNADKAFYVFGNVFLFGQDIMRFFVLDPATKVFYFQPMTDTMPSHLLASGYQLLGQAWTLSIELTFYLLVPFLIPRKTSFLVFICVLTFILRYTLFRLGYTGYNITNAFFPTALGFFLLGSLSYRCLYPKISALSSPILNKIAASLLVFILLYALWFFPHFQAYNLKHWLFIALVTLAIPYLFAGFKNSRWDNFIGELSYPAYMTQYLAQLSLLNILSFTGWQLEHEYQVYYVLIVTTIIAIIVNQVLLNPLDNLRHQWFLRKETTRQRILFSTTRTGFEV